jgi:hypothetical protein
MGTTMDRKKQCDALLPGQPSDEIVGGFLLMFSRSNSSARNPAGTFAGPPPSKAVSIVFRGASAQAPHQSASLIWLHPSSAPNGRRLGSGASTCRIRAGPGRQLGPARDSAATRFHSGTRRHCVAPARSDGTWVRRGRFSPSRLRMAFRRLAERSRGGPRGCGRSDRATRFRALEREKRPRVMGGSGRVQPPVD